MYKTLDEFKADCLFFPKGRIVPQYVMKGPRRCKHNVKFGADCWLLFTPKGHLFFVDLAAGGPDSYFIHVKNVKNVHFTMSPYSLGRKAWNMMKTRDDSEKSVDAEMLEIINRRLK